ncbi:MAG TPA: hypothetical protein VHZ24_07420 [Pirellulales bacterium]|jgi:hypothetical protein|nr:hypothetical protein [Pirellulales bacterium]
MNPLRHWKLMLGLATVFVAGMAIGAALTVGAIQRTIRDRANPETWSPRTMAWLRDEVHVTPDQESQLRSIVDQSMRDLLSLRNEAEERRRAIFAGMIAEIAPLLTDAQSEALRESIERHKSGTHGWSMSGKQR